MSGPIVRANDFFEQIDSYIGIKAEQFAIGIQIFVFGLFKKVVLADRLGIFVDDVFFAPSAYDTFTVVLAVISYSLQIYYDFSGYSDMAIGISKILGFDFKRNFNLPYISQNVSEFWKRWHISLSSWFQDYVYIPLGGNRKGEWRTYLNLMIVMMLSGLWHGAGWTFIIWGILHGIASCVYKLYGRRIAKLGIGVNVGITFGVVTLLWVVFRADSLETAIEIWKGMFTIHAGIFQPYTWSFFAILCTFISAFCAIVKARHTDRSKATAFMVDGFYPIMDLGKFWQLVVFFVFCGITIMLGYFGNTAFIYGGF